MDWFSNRCCFGNMETTLKDRFLKYFAFFLAAKCNLSLSVHPMGFLLHTLHSGHATAWCKEPGASSCTPYFSFFSTPSLPMSQHTSNPAVSHPFSWTVTLPWNLTATALSPVPSPSSVTPPGLSHQHREASGFSSMLLCWGSCTPALRSGELPPRRKVGCQVRQKCCRQLESQEGSGGTCPLAWFLQEQWISTVCLISMEPVFSDVRTALSMIPLFSTISSPATNLMRFCRSIVSSLHQAWTQSCPTDSSDAM